MQRIFFLGLLSVFAAASIFGQNAVREKEVPPQIREDFALRFSEAEEIVWLREGDTYYGARFSLKGDPAEAVYNAEGEWVQTEEHIAYLEMPDKARDYCKSNYPDYTAKDVKKVATRRYGILYEIRIRRQQKQVGMTFDMHGKLLEENEEEVIPENRKKAGIKGKIGNFFRKKSE